MTRTPDDVSVATPTFGARLRRLRESAGLSQTALAGEDLHPSYISLLESGRRAPTAEVVAVLSGRLGVSPEALSGEISLEIEEPLVLAEAALGLGRPAEAISFLEPLQGEMTVRRCTRDALLFRAADVLATAFETVGRLEDATALLETLRAAADASRARQPWLGVAVSLVRCYREAGDLDRAIDVGEDAVRRCAGLLTVSLDRQAQLVAALAGAYSERGDLLRAELLLDDLLRASGTDASSADRAEAYWNAAVVATQRGQALDAMRLCEQATTLVALTADQRSQARMQVTLAWVHLSQSPPRASEARELLLAALPELERYAGPVAVAGAETELARSELLLGQPEAARQHATSALARLAGARRLEQARAHTVLAAALVALGERTPGAASLDDACRVLAGAPGPRQAAAVWRSIGDVYRDIGDLERAQAAVNEAFAAAGVLVEPVGVTAHVPQQRRPARRGARTSS